MNTYANVQPRLIRGTGPVVKQPYKHAIRAIASLDITKTIKHNDAPPHHVGITVMAGMLRNATNVSPAKPQKKSGPPIKMPVRTAAKQSSVTVLVALI